MKNHDIDNEDSCFVDIEVETMNYYAGRGLDFHDPLNTIYIRDVSQTLNTISLQRKNLKGKNKLERIKISTETLSHEMRAPLSNIIMIMDILLHIFKRPSEYMKMKRYFNQVKSQANLLLNLVENLLDIRQIMQNKFVHKTVNFEPNRIIDQVIKMFKEQAEQTKISIYSEVVSYLRQPFMDEEEEMVLSVAPTALL